MLARAPLVSRAAAARGALAAAFRPQVQAAVQYRQQREFRFVPLAESSQQQRFQQTRSFIFTTQEPISPNNPRTRDSATADMIYQRFLGSTPAYATTSFILALIAAYLWDGFCEKMHKITNRGRMFEDMIKKHPSPYPPGTEPEEDEDEE